MNGHSFNPNSPKKIPAGKVSFLPGSERKLTAEQFQMAAAEWIHICENERVQIEVAKTNMQTGEALKMNKPIPPIIESFCRFAGISDETFRQYQKQSSQHDSLYSAVAKHIVAFCTEMINAYMLLEVIPTNAAKFYLINNSRYQDVSRIDLEVKASEQPSWLRTQKAVAEGAGDGINILDNNHE